MIIPPSRVTSLLPVSMCQYSIGPGNFSIFQPNRAPKNFLARSTSSAGISNHTMLDMV